MTKTKAVRTVNDAAKAVAKAKARPHGGKPGQARANQSAQYADPTVLTGKKPAKAKPAPKNPDVITFSKFNNAQTDADGRALIVKTATGQMVTIPTQRLTAHLNKLAQLGGSFAAVTDFLAKNKPALARGITSRDAPQSAASIQADRAKATNAAAAKAAPAKASKAATAPRGNDYAYVVVNKDHGARPDSKRALQLAIVFAHGTASAAKAAGAESVDLKFALDKGFIKLK